MRLLLSRFLPALATVLVFTASLNAVPNKTSERPDLPALKAQLLKLRNTDLNLSQRELWEETAAQLEAWTLRTNDSFEQADALFHSALAYAEISRRANDIATARLAISLFQRFCNQFATDKRCPDGLIRAAQLSDQKLNDPIHARSLYTAVTQRAPNSDAAIIARAYLKQSKHTPDNDQDSSRSPNNASTALPHGAGKLPIVVLDPGHGGDDLGATGPGGLLEKDVTLAIALEVNKLAVERAAFTVVLTRDSDRFVPLAERTAKANSEGGVVFVSIHANASPNHSLSGIESYFLDNTDDAASKRLAQIENSAGGKAAGSDLDLILSDMVQAAKIPQSTGLAQTLQSSVLAQLQTSGWRDIRDHGVKKAPFFVLIGARMPCILMELAYIDHVSDGQNLATPEFRSALARGILVGIERYLSTQVKS